MYAERQRRQAAERSFGGTKEEFLESAGTRVTIAAATAADVPRLHELAARTRQFNSAAGRAPATGAGPGAGMTQDWFRALLAAGDRDVVTVRLRDAFGDDGLVGGCVVMREAGIWTVPLLMMSCRAMGRGVIDVLLAWLVRQAARAGARRLRVPFVANSRNVPLRLALTAAGFRAPETAGTADQGIAGGDPHGGNANSGNANRANASSANASSGQDTTVFQRDVGTGLPVLPGCVEAPGEQGGDAA
jgi:FkbH-like protein